VNWEHYPQRCKPTLLIGYASCSGYEGPRATALGRVVDCPVDNLLAECACVGGAEQCAAAMQWELKTRNAELPSL
jgi:hypothetical protein